MPKESANTSLNQIPAGLKYLAKTRKKYGSNMNLDFGGGKYDKGSEYLLDFGIINKVYDPFNRSVEHNCEVIHRFCSGEMDTITLLNVLNVIPDRTERQNVIDKIIFNMEVGNTLIIGVYEGNRSGITKQTSKGFQLNQKRQFYIDEITRMYNHGFISIEKDSQFIIIRRLK